MKIPYTDLASDTLDAIIEEFVLREGTDYGEQIFDLESKCAAVRRQLQRGEAEVCFDPVTQSIDIRPC